MHWTDFHDFLHHGRFLTVVFGSDILFLDRSRDVAMTINFRGKLANQPSFGTLSF